LSIEKEGIEMARVLCAWSLLVVVVIAVATPARGGDWEVWSGTAVSGAIDENTSFKCGTSFRRDDDGDRLYFSLVEFGFDRKVANFLTLGAYYAHVNQGQGSSWGVEYRPHVNATLKWTLGPLNLSDRNRLEFRTIQCETNTRYRNRLMVSLNALRSAPASPYVAVEPFYDFKAEEMNKNRTYAGAIVKFGGGLGADLYYMYESRLKNDEWTGVPVAGATLTYSF
jgi:hypothetical protein